LRRPVGSPTTACVRVEEEDRGGVPKRRSYGEKREEVHERVKSWLGGSGRDSRAV